METTVKEIDPALRKRLIEANVGRTRYKQIDEGQTVYHGDYMGTEYWCPENLTRERCVDMKPGVNDRGEPIMVPVWVEVPDAPAPLSEFGPSGARASHNEDPAAAAPAFDWQPPAYASDTQSGGPANFHGNAGGPDNPRDPNNEGEVPGQYQAMLAEFREQLAANTSRVKEMEAVILSGDAKQLAAFQKKIQKGRGQ